MRVYDESMAVAPIPPLVSVDEYLNSSYSPDKEYVDGVLVERGMSTIAHSLCRWSSFNTLASIRSWAAFYRFQKCGPRSSSGLAIEIPDVMLCPVPLPTGKVVTSVPWVVTEILSPDDKLPDQLERFRDYKRISVRHVVLLDPERLIAYRFEDGSLLQTQFTSLDLPSGSVPFETAVLFQQLVEQRSEGTP